MHPETISRILPGIKTNYLDSIREESSNLSRSPSHEENPISQQNDSHHHTQTYLISKDQLMGELRKQYQPKILQNCQRTARVILISQLDKKVNSKRSIKQKLHQILSQFIPDKRSLSSDDDDFERNNNGNYYHSVNYSRVKIGQKIFEKQILLNPLFKEQFLQIFRNGKLHQSDKPRKNQRSKITFQQRKQILEKILEINQINFLTTLKIVHNTHDSSIVQTEEMIFEEKKEQVIEAIEVEPQMEVCLRQIKLPFVPIPLSPQQYNEYMITKGLL